MEFKDIIRQLRKERKLKQSDLAEILDVDRTAVGKWESGKSKPTVDMLILIANYFDVSTDYLLGLSNMRADISAEQKKPINDDGLSDNKKLLLFLRRLSRRIRRR